MNDDRKCRDRAALQSPWTGGSRLRNLLELMRQFQGDFLFSFASLVGGASGMLGGASLTYDVVRKAGNIPSDSRDLTISEKWRGLLIEYQEKAAREICKAFDLPASAAKCEEII